MISDNTKIGTGLLFLVRQPKHDPSSLVVPHHHCRAPGGMICSHFQSTSPNNSHTFIFIGMRLSYTWDHVPF